MTFYSNSLSAAGITIDANDSIKEDSTGGQVWTITRGKAIFNNLTANGTDSIGGWTICSDSLSSGNASDDIAISSNGTIKSNNGKWEIKSDGSYVFKDVSVCPILLVMAYLNLL